MSAGVATPTKVSKGSPKKESKDSSKEQKRKSKASSESTPSSSKKQKSASTADESPSKSIAKVAKGEATLKVSGSKKAFKDLSKAGAAFACFADYNPAPSTNFSIYRAEAIPDESGYQVDEDDERLILAGETDTMNYISNNFEFGSSSERRGYSGEYMVGLYDPSSSTVTLRAVPTFRMSRSIKAASSFSSISSSKTFDNFEEVQLARRSVMEAFGNRKQKAKQSNQDRMKVDTNNMDIVLDDFTGGIETSLASLPSLEEITALSNANRPMPPPNLDAKHPAEAYALSVLIPPAVQRVMPIQRLIDTADDLEEMKKLLPLPKAFPKWIFTRLAENAQRASHLSSGKKHTTFDEDDDEAESKMDIEGDEIMPALGATEDKEDAKTKVRIAYYMALLYVAYTSPKIVGNKHKFIDLCKLDGEDSAKQVMNSIYQTFTETPQGSHRAVMTPFNQAKCLAYMCALALHLDNFSVDYDSLARNCNINPQQVREVFRSLGCTPGSVRGDKRMVLKTPFTLPQPRRGGPAKR